MNKDKILLIIFCIFLPILLLLTSYKVVVGLSDFTPNQQETIDFLYQLGELQLNYTANEISHLVDVQKIMQLYDYVFYLSLLIVTILITYYKRNKKQLLKLFKCGGITAVGFTVIKTLFALFGFNYAFEIFHEILFPQGNWKFPANSLLIKTFPLEFFITLSLKIFFLAIVLGSIFISVVFYYHYVRSSKRN